MNCQHQAHKPRRGGGRGGTPILGYDREVPQYYLTDFKHFVSIYSVNFGPIDSPFHWFYIFLTPHFQKTLDPIGSKLYSCAEPGYRKFDEVPPSGLPVASNTYLLCGGAVRIHPLFGLISQSLHTILCYNWNDLSTPGP